MKPKIPISIFKDDIYKFEWMLIKGGTLNDAIKIFSKALNITPWEVEHNKRYAHFAAYRPLKNGLLWFKDKKIKASTAAHECFHATMYLFETLELDGPKEKTEEVFAYYLEWLVESVADE